MRLFVAIRAPEGAHAAISKAAGPLQEAMGVRPLSSGNWHITLKFIGDVEGSRADAIADALSAVSFSPFAVKLRGGGAYPSERFPRAVYIGGVSPGAEELAKKVEAALAPLDLPSDGKAFSVHLTVARSRGAGDIEEFAKNTGEVCEFEVRSFALMRSTLMAHEARYEVIREYPAK